MPPHFVPFRDSCFENARLTACFTRTTHRSLSAPTYRPGIGSSLDIHRSMLAALSERRNRQRKRRQKDDFSTSARHGSVESFSSPCDVSNSYNENSNQAVENPTSSSYFIPGISGKARCLTDACCDAVFGETRTRLTNDWRWQWLSWKYRYFHEYKQRNQP